MPELDRPELAVPPLERGGAPPLRRVGVVFVVVALAPSASSEAAAASCWCTPASNRRSVAGRAARVTTAVLESGATRAT